MAKAKRIRTVLYDDQPISRTELELLHTHMFQRLYGLHQLGLADRVFIDASHSRLHHVVGVLAQVEKLMSATSGNLRRSREKELRYGASREIHISSSELADRVDAALPIARLIGFLHDLTHAPYGHTVEDEIQLMATKHDDPERQSAAYYRLICDLFGWLASDLSSGIRRIPLSDSFRAYLRDPEVNAPPMPQDVVEIGAAIFSLESAQTQLFWRISPSEARLLLAQLRVAMKALLHLELLHTSAPEPKHFPKATYAFDDVIVQVLSRVGAQQLLEENDFDSHRDAYILDIVGNTVCADILDYAQRDAHYANLKLTYDADRIAENFTLVAWRADTYPYDDSAHLRKCPEGTADPFSGHAIRAAISLFSHKLRTDIPGELMNLLNVRFYLYERVIYHPTKTAAGAMLGSALQLLGWTPDKDATTDVLPEWLRYVGDDVFVFAVNRAANVALSLLEGKEEVRAAKTGMSSALSTRELDLACNILTSNEKRPREEAVKNLHAAIALLARLRARRFVKPVFRALPNVAPEGIDADAKNMAELFKDSIKRFETERQIEVEAGLPRGSITIHCPRLNTAEKIANVLLVLPPMPSEHGRTAEKVRKLRHIDKFVDKVFDAHAKAIQAVEQMYTSMWRLVVYVVPEHFDQWEKIERVVGRRLFELLADRPAEAEESLPNDHTLQHEIRLRLEESVPIEPEPPAAGDVKAITSQLAEAVASESSNVSRDILVGDVTSLIERLRREPADRKQKRLLRFASIARPYFGGRLTKETRSELERELSPDFLTLDDNQFDAFLGNLQERVAATPVSPGLFFREQLKNFIGEAQNLLRKRLSRETPSAKNPQAT